MTRERIQEYTLKITNASAAGIVVILYDLAIEYIGDAKKCFAENDHEGAKVQCANAGRVLGDLMASLDLSYEISFPLFRIYEYVSREVSMAVIKNDASSLDDCVRLLTELKGSFEKIAVQDETGPVMENTQSVYAGLTYGKGTLNESTGLSPEKRGYTV